MYFLFYLGFFIVCIFLIFLHLLFLCMCVCTWVYIHALQHIKAHEGQKSCKVLLELELQIALSQNERAESHTWLLCKRSKHSIC